MTGVQTCALPIYVFKRAEAGEDPTGGATNFFGYKAQNALGRKFPDFGPGIIYGNTSFHKEGDPNWQQGKSTDMYDPTKWGGRAAPQGGLAGAIDTVRGGISDVADTAKSTVAGLVPADYRGRETVKDPITEKERPRTWGD